MRRRTDDLREGGRGESAGLVRASCNRQNDASVPPGAFSKLY
jgi:hypothetical protein